MLTEPTSYLYVYAITRDFGFAPNPFHGYCTLATCKPIIRKTAHPGDWILGVGGSKLHPVQRKCVFLMKVSEKVSFEEYWSDDRFSLKKPVRNGSLVQMVGDNIYHKGTNGEWIQEDSHHSKDDGTTHPENLERDTSGSQEVLISDCFYYFGNKAIKVDLDSIGFAKIRGHIKVDLSQSLEGRALITNLMEENRMNRNLVTSDPVQFMDSYKRADQITGKIS